MASRMAWWVTGASIFRVFEEAGKPRILGTAANARTADARGQMGVNTGCVVCLVPSALRWRKPCSSDFST